MPPPLPEPGRTRHAVVTGAARGIGAAVARALAADGARLTLMGRDRAALDALAATLPGGPHAVATVDVADAASVQAAFGQAREALGPVDILVNNAGQAASAPFAKTSLELWNRMLAVNLTGCFLCAQAALPDMVPAGWGRIVNIASTAGLVGYAYVAAYTAAKHGVVGLTRALALETARKGVTVNAVCPGYTETDLLRESIANVVAKTGRSEGEARASFAAGNPQGRIVQPEEVADAVRWLCSGGAGAITGQSISVSGGEVT
jgi:NAD(P)-dependent dehydrogenase (short-subunit alcohol dehydrogenase family)